MAPAAESPAQASAATLFMPDISGTLRIRYIDLQEGRYESEASTWVALTSHTLRIERGDTVITDSLNQRFRFRARDALRYGFYYENRYYQSRWSQTSPFRY